MKRFSILLFGALQILLVVQTEAFSLLGPDESWMTPTNGFRAAGDIGGPVNIGEGYRWNVPVLTYAFDPSFAAFFGSNGEAAVQSAIQILNNLPPASQGDPSNYPLNTMTENYQAAALGLVDLKSETLFRLLQQLGLASPERFMFCVHDFSIAGGNTNVNIVLRNFDPFLDGVTNALNGVLYSSNLTWYTVGSMVGVVVTPVPVDPLNASPAVADGWVETSSGMFYTGLTRDDVGGLKYLLETNNVTWETLLPDVHGIGANSNNYVNLAMRAGVDKITFISEASNFDFFTGEFLTPVTNQYTDVYLTNGVWKQQRLERVSDRPDIIFAAYVDTNEVPVVVESTGASNWLNNASLNGNPGAGGPGTIRPQVTIAFPKYGLNGVVTTSDTGDITQGNDERWGSFNGSTNPPVIYPVGTTGTGNPWTIHLSLLSTNYQALPGGYFTWQLPVSLETAVSLETSTNLADWTPMATVVNYGIPILWQHLYSRPVEYFRAVPQ